MKRILSILLIALFLFNVGGFFLLFWVLRIQSNEKLAARLDAGLYQKAETIELKIPVTMPYPLQERGFERAHGKFEYGGEFYKLVEQKLENDTLYIICIKNHDEKRLVNTMTNFASVTTETPVGTKNALNFLNNFLKEYNSSSSVEIEVYARAVSTISFKSFREDPLPGVATIESVPPEV